VKVLLVGGRGFIGREILLQLKQLGWEVTEFNRTETNPLGYMNKLAVTELFANHSFDCVISTAWNTSHATYRDSSENFQHQAATENLASEAKRYSVPIFVALGSAAEYGDNNLAATSLSSILKPIDNYSSAKTSTFLSLNRIFESTGTLLIWHRIFQPYGHGQDPKRFLPTLISKVSSGSKMEIKNPEHICDWINVIDVAKAILYSIQNKIGGAIDVGTGIGTSNKHLASVVSNIFGLKNLASEASVDSQVQGLCMDSNTHLLNHGWVPEFTLESGIKDLVSKK
jgi:dTDP-6-deoxy-L-talose 4-dehydrogenase (NAD+)